MTGYRIDFGQKQTYTLRGKVVGDKWRYSICTRFYPLLVLLSALIVCLVATVVFFLIDNAVFNHRIRAIEAKYKTLSVGMTSKEVMGIMGEPQGKTVEASLSDALLKTSGNEKVVYHYEVRDILGYKDSSYPVYLNSKGESVVSLKDNNMFLIGIAEPFGPQFVILGSWAAILIVVWLSFRFWCRKRVIRTNSTSSEG